jgi:hypothetical protein
MYLKLLAKPNPSALLPNVYCEGINPEDGKWQGCVIERISD